MATSVSDIYRKYRKLNIPPIIEALGAGALATTGGMLAWNPIVDTIMSLGRRPAKAMGLTEGNLDEIEYKLKNNAGYSKFIPAAFGAALAAGTAGLSWRANKEYGGMLDRSAPWKPLSDSTHRGGNVVEMSKDAALNELSAGFDFENMDTSKRIDSSQADWLFSDAHLSPYARNMGTAIVNNAVNQSGVSNPTMGNIIDSAVDKFNNKLSFAGLAEVGVRSVVANGMANMFASALGSMTGLSHATQRNIVEAGTWAGAINALIN